MNPYKILGVPESATIDEIKAAYRERAKRYHPDAGGDAWAFQQLQAAYESLLSISSRNESSEGQTTGADETDSTDSVDLGALATMDIQRAVFVTVRGFPLWQWLILGTAGVSIFVLALGWIGGLSLVAKGLIGLLSVGACIACAVCCRRYGLAKVRQDHDQEERDLMLGAALLFGGVSGTLVFILSIWSFGWILVLKTMLSLSILVTGGACGGWIERRDSESRKNDESWQSRLKLESYRRYAIAWGVLCALLILVGAICFQGAFLVVAALGLAFVALFVVSDEANLGYLGKRVAKVGLVIVVLWHLGPLKIAARWWLSERQSAVSNSLKSNFARGTLPATNQNDSPTAEVLTLASGASIRDLSEAYRPYFYFVTTTYREHKREQFGESKQNCSIFGSGILVAHDKSTGLILTNRHVISPTEFAKADDRTNVRFSEVNIAVQTRSDESLIPAQVVAEHKERDIALVLVERDFDNVAAIQVLSETSVDLGRPVVAFGNQLGIGFRQKEGTISSEGIPGVVDHSCSIDHGFSGGPLLTRDGGQLIGINTLAVGRGGNYAILVASLVESMKSLHVEREGLFVSTIGGEGSRDWVWRFQLSGEATRKVARLAKLVSVVD